MMENKSDYSWKFSKIGGVTRVSIETGDDIKHLSELDPKLWTVLSCPSVGLEFDAKTLEVLDVNKDGKIRVNEVVKISQWLCSIVKNPDLLVKRDSSIKLSDINQDTDEGKKILASAGGILKNLSLQKDEISIDDTKDLTKVFANTAFNGDGIITELSAAKDNHKDIVKLIIDKIGSADDRSGEKGVNKDQIDEFYKELADFAEWKKIAADNKDVLAYGDKTDAALKAYEAVKQKIEDYFVRCKMVAFNKDTYSAMEISLEEIAKISGDNLSEKIAELAKYPIARISETKELPLNQPINPAWEKAFADVKALVFDVDFAGKDSITEAEFLSVAPKFAAYKDWLGKKKGAKVESLDLGKVEELLSNNSHAELLELVERDMEHKDEAEGILNVDSFLHCYQNFYSFLRNFVTFSDFYDPKHEKLSVFQAGRLYIDQRECGLCIKVSDMAKHNATAAASGMYLVYCDCVSQAKKDKMQICAVITNGSTDNIMVGKNAIFYDRKEEVWDATVTKIIENPISIREAFFAPYKKFVGFVEKQVNDFAAKKDKEMTDKASTSISETGTKLAEKPVEAAPEEGAPAPVPGKKEPFDMAKFCGIFAAIGLALGYIGGFLVSVVTGFAALSWWQMILAIIGILLLISGPSMLLAYMKLRRRNLSPLLNANGWAVNAQAFVNIMFGSAFTKLAKFPIVNVKDPLADKGYPKWKLVLWIVLIIAIIAFVLYCKGKLGRFGLAPAAGSVLDFSDPVVPAAAVAPAE